jgi:ribonuclease BN (tRNA processing enzyme)
VTADPLLTILGSGTLLPDAERHSSAHHLRFGDASVLLDCGPGTVHGFARYGVRWQELTHVAVSHFHNDHIGDLGALMFAFRHGLASPRVEPLTLVGPPGFAGLLDRLAWALGSHVLDPGFEVRVVEVSPETPFEEPWAGFTLSCHRTPHTAESVAYRLEGTWDSVGYTGDTGPSEEVGEFLEGCGALIAECTLPDSSPIDIDTHLSPTSLATLARCARPELLLVVHVGPRHSPEAAAERIRALYEGSVVPAVDGLRIRFDAKGPSVDPGPGLL